MVKIGYMLSNTELYIRRNLGGAKISHKDFANERDWN